ncbi:methionyl-tRNA formyltransferase-like [Quillaja saponaria]|uniref:Methionyl-tRNA formyltransferase-like n=1 Tax=Quillaja saponaria TaxID=32244 RepID=A0AAD7PXZ9_QUISA|nr:methionyl-tRNA formyltransferase-like [Quillaja saponaria]
MGRRGYFLSNLKALQPELCITAACGNILPSKFLNILPLGTVNIHPIPPPLYSCAAPFKQHYRMELWKRECHRYSLFGLWILDHIDDQIKDIIFLAIEHMPRCYCLLGLVLSLLVTCSVTLEGNYSCTSHLNLKFICWHLTYLHCCFLKDPNFYFVNFLYIGWISSGEGTTSRSLEIYLIIKDKS